MEDIDNNETNNENLLSISQEDLDKRIQSAEDKVRTKYSNNIKDIKAKHSAEIDSLTQQISELEKLKPIEKSEKELELERRETELKAKERAVKLKEVGIDEDFSKFLKSDVDIDELSKTLSSIIDKNANDKIVNNGFKPFNSVTNGLNMPEKEFSKMSYNERLKIFNENPDLYTTLSKK